MFDEAFEGTWDIEMLFAYNEEFALGLEHIMQCASERGDEQYAKCYIGQVMKSYGNYLEGQTEEWLQNPAKMLAGIGAARDGPSRAQALRTLDQGGC